MNFLLDTHVWVWTLIAPEQLNAATRDILSDTQNTCFLSPISVWELLLLIEKQRIVIHTTTPDQWVKMALQNGSLSEAPLTHAVALRSRQINLPHQDPADRFIAATALEYGLTLMTADQHLRCI